MTLRYFSISASAYITGESTYLFDHDSIPDTEGHDQDLFGLLVAVALFGAGTVTSILDDPAGATPAMNLSLARADTNGSYRSEIWFLPASMPGSHEITVNLSASLSFAVCALSYQFSGVLGAVGGATGTGTPASQALTTLYDNSIVFSHLACQTTSGVTNAGGQNERYSQFGALVSGLGSDKGPVSPVGETTLQFNNVGVADLWAISCVELISLVANPPAIMV